jgi:hypothetical protein
VFFIKKQVGENMKNKKILIISLCAVLIALVAAVSVMLKRNSISKHSLIYADVNDKLISYKISEKAKTRIFFDGYSEYLLVGKYIGGEYCCVSKGENSLYDVLLIKNGNIEKTYQLSFCPDEIAATDDGIYCLTNGKIYRLSTADNTESLYKDNVYTNYRLNMLITDKGDLVYSRQENNGNVSLVLDCDGQETDVFTFNPDDTIAVGLNTDNRFLYKDKSDNYKTMAVSVYGGKQQKYGKSVTFVQASSDGKLAVKYKRQVLGECSDVYIVDGKTGIAVSTHLVDLDIPYSVVVV